MKKMMHYGKLLALAGLVGIVSAEAGGSAYFYRRTMMRYFRGAGNVEEKKCKKAVICFHGYTSQGLADYGSISNYYLKRGYNVLLVDQRSHGQS